MKYKLQKILENYGIRHQLKKFNEESFELVEACIISNTIDYYSNEETIMQKHNILTEVADVQVMLEQIKLYYNISDEEVKEEMDFKVNRQIKRIERENENEKNDR